jgi:hypothetical protein
MPVRPAGEVLELLVRDFPGHVVAVAHHERIDAVFSADRDPVQRPVDRRRELPSDEDVALELPCLDSGRQQHFDPATIPGFVRRGYRTRT